MNVKELKAELEDLPDDMEVILQKDAEGNGYSPLAGANADAIYMTENTYSGLVFSTYWTAEDVGVDEEEWARIKTNPQVVVLYPIN